MIEIRNLKKVLNGKKVLDGIDLDVREGETLVIMGPSGTGKSVLIKHIVGLFDPDAGDILVDGLSVIRAGGREIGLIRSKISYVFQNSALFDSLTVAQNIRLGLDAELCDREPEECTRRVRESLTHVNLGPEVLGLLPAELSGGMQKRVAIARSIVGRRKYVLYDEPTTGLDPVNAAVVNDLIARLKEEIGLTSVVVTHDVESAFFLGDRIALLAEGKIQALGTPEDMKNSENPAVQRFLSGRSNLTMVA
ncbi:MAG: ATP-binding cassette domain-containing protein [Candidatus Palauibacterales bacterium]|nr:ATP-binding cassette domain-containing protein [Candidatus Palauibacterales bacterium]MDP2530486.1 ATP-binding cassette domain-containing protein [Candidatus Palauibacterales bacterium]MDP2582955.1 ATP-binding cassette domain-containing protein [Candidatus Palauibacterales bacterium]